MSMRASVSSQVLAPQVIFANPGRYRPAILRSRVVLPLPDDDDQDFPVSTIEFDVQGDGAGLADPGGDGPGLHP